MPVTNEQVRAILDLDEPDYEAASQLGPEALPILQRFVESGDPNRAAKAAYLAGRIGDPSAAPILEFAATSPEAGVRAAAASGARSWARPGILSCSRSSTTTVLRSERPP